MSFSLFRRKKAQLLPHSNVVSLESRSLDTRTQLSPGAFVQSLEGATLGDIHGSLMSHNQISTVHQNAYQFNVPSISQTVTNINQLSRNTEDDNDDYHVLKAGDLILESQLRTARTHFDLQEDGTFGPMLTVTDYTGRVSQSNSHVLIRRYEEAVNLHWTRDLDCLVGARHPNILQLYGVCRSTKFRALVFHNTTTEMTVKDYHKSLHGTAFVTYLVEVGKQMEGACQLLKSHNLQRDCVIERAAVDTTGSPILTRFSPLRHDSPWMHGPLFAFRQSPPDEWVTSALVVAMQNNSWRKEDIPYYYAALESLSSFRTHWDELDNDFHPLCLKYPNLGVLPLHAEGLLTLEPDYPSLPLIGEVLPNLTIRFRISTNDMTQNHFFYHGYIVDNKGPGNLFFQCLSQVHHYVSMAKDLKEMKSSPSLSDISPMYHYIALIGLIGVPTCLVIRFHFDKVEPDLEISRPEQILYIFCTDLFSSRPRAHWALDPEGLREVLGGELERMIGFKLESRPHLYWSYSKVRPQVLTIVRQIHEGCGFDPDSPEIAEYLGYSLLVPSKSELYADDLPSDECDRESVVE
ncbi:hypothetical protein C8J56DRAFT_973092 [Mycena floridula]|nr:hypothetical protein C8J56DRAFT_973092 [Mycena floridula]